MNKTKVYKFAFGTILLLFCVCLILQSCDKYEELPPINNHDLIGKYNEPKGTVPSQEEIDLVKDIVNEYNSSTED